MAMEDETREAADGTEVQVEAVDLGTGHFEAHPEFKLPSIMEIKNVGEAIDSTEGTLQIPEDQVLVEAPSELELPPEHQLNGKASSPNGHMDKEEKISDAQLHENDQKEAELDGTSAHQSHGINKEEVTDGLSHGESTTEHSSLLKHEKDEEPRDDRQDSEGVTVDDDLVQEDTLKTDNSVEQTDDGQRDQNQEPEKANEDAQPASITNNADIEEAEAPTGIQTPVEPHMDDYGAVPVTIEEKIEMMEPATADDVVHPDHKENFPEETSIAGPTEEVLKVEIQQSQQSYAMDVDVVQEEMLKCEETHAQEEVPKSEAPEPMTNAQEMLNKESAEGIDDPMNEENEETAHQINMEAPKETTPELDTTTREPPVNVQVQNHEQSEEIEHAKAVDTEADMQQSSVAFEDIILEDQYNLGVTKDNDTVQEDTLKAIEQKDDGRQDQDLEDTQPAIMANTPEVEVIAEAPSGVQTHVEPNLENSDAVPDTIDGNTETDKPAKADCVVHPDHKESFPEDASIAEPTEEVAKMEDPQSQQADAVDADVVQEEVPKFEHADEPTTNAHEVLNQESTEETDGLVNEKTEETAHQSNMAVPEETTPENDTITGEPPVNIQVQNIEKIKDAEEVDAGAAMQQSSVAFDKAVPEDQHNLGITMDGDTVQQDTLDATEQTEDTQGQDLEPEKTSENIQPATMTNIPDVEVVSESPSGVQTPVAINLENSDAIRDTAGRNTETDESAKAEGTTEISEPQMTEAEEKLKDIEATEAQEITEHGHVTPSKELSAEDDSTTDETQNDDIQQTLGQDSVEVKETVFTSEDTVLDNVTAEEPTCDSQEVDNAESTKETKGNTAENVEVSDVVIVDEAVKEQDVLQTEDITETHMQELEPEETKNTEPVESKEASDQRNAVLFNDLAQEDTQDIDMQQTESATETTETEAAPQESKNCVSDEPSPEDHKIESEKDCDTQGVSITEYLEVIDGDKDIITGGISGQSNMVSAGESAQENYVPESKSTADIQPVQELEPEEIKNTELTEVKETSHEMNTTVFQTPTEEDNPATVDLHESARELSNIEATEAGTPHQSDAAQSEEQAPEGIASEPQVLETESVEEMNDTTDISNAKLISSSGESVPQEIATEDNTSTEPDVDHQQVQEQESSDFMETEENKPQEIVPSCILSTSEKSTSEDNATAIAEDNATAMEPNSDTEAESLQPAEVTEGTEKVESNTALGEAATPEENVETGAAADMPSVQEPELEETKDAEPAGTEDIMASIDLPAGNMDMETMGTEAVPHESHVESIKELTQDGTEQVLELESFENTKCIDTMEHPGEPHGSTSDETTPTEENTTVTERAFDTQQVQNLTSQEIKDSEDAKTDEFSDLSSFPTKEADQESDLPRTEPATDVQQVQETRDIESEGTENHQQHRFSTSEEPTVDSEPNVDDQQMHEDRVPEVKDNQAMEAEEVIQRSNIDIQDYATGERSELTSEPDSYVQPAQDVDSENSQIEKVGTVTIEETPTEDSTASQISPPVDIKQEHELEPVEEIKGTDANEAEEEFHTSQVDAIEKSDPEANMASIETTSDIKQENELEATKEINIIEAVNDGEQIENATSEDPSTTDNETTPEGHSAELNGGNKTDDVKDEIQTSEELKDGACDLGETVLPTQGSEDVTDENDVQSHVDVDSENHQLEKAEETSSIFATEETPTEDSIVSEIDPPVDIKQEHELEPVEEIKGTDANEAEEEFHTSQVDAIEKSASEGNIASIETTSDIKQEPTSDTMQENELEATKEINNTEVVNDGEQTENATSEDPSTTDNETTPEGHSVELNGANETDDVKDEIQTSKELKDGACDLGETVLPTQGSENMTDEDVVQSPGDVDSENHQLEKAEETLGTVATEETPTEDSIVSEIDQPVDIKQEQELEPVEEIMGTDANEAKEEFHTSKVDAIEKSASEGNMASIEPTSNIRQEPTSDIKQENELEETKEINNIEAVNDGEQTENATSEDPSTTDNDTTPEEHSAELNGEIMGNENDDIKDEIQTPKELKDGACDLGETVLPTEGSENMTDEDVAQSPVDVDNENHQLEKVEETAGTVATEETPTEDSIVSEIDPSVDIKQEHELEPVEDIKGTDANEAEEEFHTSQVDAIEKSASEGNMASIETTSDIKLEPTSDIKQEPSSDIKQENELEATKEINNIEVVNDGEQTENATSEDPSTTDNETTPEGHSAELNGGNETDDVKDEIQTSEELKDGACDLGETVLPTQGNEDMTDEDVVQSPVDVDSENHQLEKIEETAGTVATEETPTEESIVSEIDPPVNIKQEHELEPVEEIKGIDANEAEEEFHTSQVDAIEKSASEANMASIETTSDIKQEPSSDIKQENELEATKEINITEVVNDGEQTENATSEDPSTTDNETTPEGHSAELNGGNETDDVKDEIHTSEELKDGACDLGETVSPTQGGENMTDEDVVQSPGYDEIEESSFDKIEETVSHEKTEASTTEAVIVNDNITNKASEDDGEPSDGNPKTFNDTGKDLDVSSVIIASKEESINENMEDHKLALPAQDENTPEQKEKTEREMPSSEKVLRTEPEENQIPNEINEEELQNENQIPNEKNEEDIQDTEIADAQNDVEPDLPVSHFLMNLILGKKNGIADENSEPEAEGKQGETAEDDSYVLISKEEESVGPLCTENKVDDNLTFEQEKHDVKCSEETQEMVKEQSDDLKLDIERSISIHTDEESNKNTQGNPQDKISEELLSEEAASVSTNMKARDIEISNFQLDDKAVDTVNQEDTEESTKIENGSLKSNINDLTNTEASEEDTQREQQTKLLHESVPEDNSADALSAPLLIESGVVDAKDSSYDAEAAQNLTCAKEDDPAESSIIEATSSPHIQLECEEAEKIEEEQHASKGTENVPIEAVESSNDNPQKSTSSEVTPHEQASHITEPVIGTEKILAPEKEICEGSTCMDEKENSNFSIKGVENFQTAVEIQADSPNMQINQDKKDEVADNKTAMGPENLGGYGFQEQQEIDRKHEVADNKTAMGPEKLGESDFQEHQKTDTEQKSTKVIDEGDQQFLVKKEIRTEEQVVPRTVESHEQTVSIKSNEKQELFDSKVQERDLNVVSPREASEAEENFVSVTKPEFSTDEEQSPKADADEKTYDEKIKDVEGTKDFTDGAATKTEAPGATKKSPKKLNLLSGVGSKVKHQLAKVKKAIVGKPGNTKPDSPKS